MSMVRRLVPAVLALLITTTSGALAQDPATLVAARSTDTPAPMPVRMLCSPRAMGLTCSATNVRAAVTSGVGGRSQTLTIAPYQPYVAPRGRTLVGFDVEITAYLSRSAGGRMLLLADIAGDARSLDLSDQVPAGHGGIRTIRFATDTGWISETFDEDGAAVLRLPMHLMLTAQTRTARDIARLDVIGVELRPVFQE